MNAVPPVLATGGTWSRPMIAEAMKRCALRGAQFSSRFCANAVEVRERCRPNDS